MMDLIIFDVGFGSVVKRTDKVNYTVQIIQWNDATDVISGPNYDHNAGSANRRLFCICWKNVLYRMPFQLKERSVNSEGNLDTCCNIDLLA